MKKYCEKNDLVVERAPKRPREEELAVVPVPVETASFESKVELAEKVKNVSHDVLAEMVKIVETQCKAAIEDLGNDRVQIKVDELDKPTYDKLCL